MKNLKIIGLIFGVMFVGCAPVTPIFSFTYTSTKKKHIDPSAGTKVGDAQSEYICKGKNGLGLMETAVNDALEKVGGGATYIKNAEFVKKGNCVSVSGEAYK